MSSDDLLASDCFPVRNELAEVGRVLDTLAGHWATVDLNADTEATINIAVEEILSNVIRHGGKPGHDHQIGLRLEVFRSSVAVTIDDDGIPFDPLAASTLDPNASLDERRAGGMGLHMVKKMMDQLSYENTDGRNRIRMVKNRP